MLFLEDKGVKIVIENWLYIFDVGDIFDIDLFLG